MHPAVLRCFSLKYHPNDVVDAYLFVHDGVAPVGDLVLQGATLTEGVIGAERPVRVVFWPPAGPVQRLEILPLEIP